MADNAYCVGDSYLAAQEITCLLRNPKVYHAVQKSLPNPMHPVSIWLINSVPTLSILIRSTLILSFHLHLSLPSILFLLHHRIKPVIYIKYVSFTGVFVRRLSATGLKVLLCMSSKTGL